MIIVNYGRDWAKAAYGALAASDICAFLKPGMSVRVKPNLVTAQPASNGATTHPEVVEGILMFLRDFGARDVAVIENSAVGHSAARAFKVCGYGPLRERYGVPLIDLRGDKCAQARSGGLDLKVCETALRADFLINVPVLKAHCQTRMTCCMKNLKGCIPQSEMRRFHALGLHRPIAALNALFKNGYCVVDGICGDLSFEEGGTPVEANRIIAGRNALAVDSFCAGLIGYEPDDIGYLPLGRELGVGEYHSPDARVVELNPEGKPGAQAKAAAISAPHRALIDDDAACSVCYAALAFALHRNGGRSARGGKICVGQGFRGKGGEGLGVGDCAAGFARHVGGCPPRAVDILPFL